MRYLFLADGFEEIEALTTVDILRRAGIKVWIVGVGRLDVRGAHGITVTADLLDKEIDYEKVSLVILPGGMPGAENLGKSIFVDKAIRNCISLGGNIAAICAAPMVLGRKGLTQGKKMTCYPGFEKELVGAHTSENGVVKDGNFITAKGPGVTFDFAFEILKLYKDKETVKQLKESMQWKENE